MNSTRLQIRSAKNVEILTLLIQGYTPKQIAPKVGIKPNSVTKRLERLRLQFDCQTTAELAVKVAPTIKRAA